MDAIDTRGKAVIFYGAGHEAQFEISKYRKIGVEPVCLCDKDTEKWGRSFWGVECIPLEEAVKKYPDFVMVITPRFPLRFRIMEELLNSKTVTKDQLLNYEPYIKMKSCLSLHSILDANAAKVFAICCGQIESSRRPQIPFDGNLVENIQKIEQHRREILENLNSPNPKDNFCACDNCRWATVDYWPVDTRIRTLKYDFGGRCQFNCTYCFSPARHNMVEPEWSKQARLPELTACLKQIDALHPEAVIEYAAGEICVAPNQEEIYGVLEHYDSVIITNAGQYSPGLAELIAMGRVRAMLVSLDAGTAETFQIVKGGAGNFNQVKANLAKYIALGALVDLKYIFVKGVNDKIEDVEGFVALAKELGVNRISISKDHRNGVVSEEAHIFSLMKYMISCAHKNRIAAILASGFFTDDEIKLLNSVSL